MKIRYDTKDGASFEQTYCHAQSTRPQVHTEGTENKISLFGIELKNPLLGIIV